MRGKRNYIFAGISLQGKNNSQELFANIIKYAVKKYEMSRLVFLIADEIELINQRVFSRTNEINNRRTVENIAQEIEEDIIAVCPVSFIKNKKVLTCRWRCILDKNYFNNLLEFKRLFSRSDKFRNDIFVECERYAIARSKQLSEGELLYLSDYILQELPTLINGVVINGRVFNKMIYPAPKNAGIDTIANNIIQKVYGEVTLRVPYCVIDRFNIN